MANDLTFDDLNQSGAMELAGAAFAMGEDAFRGFYERNARAVWAFLARVTGDPHAADDLLQETFFRFLRASAVYEDENHRKNALFRIAANLAKDARRASLRRPSPGATGEEAERVVSRDRLEAADSATDVSRALACLKPREREMLWLAYAEGATHDEIAQTLGLRSG